MMKILGFFGSSRDDGESKTEVHNANTDITTTPDEVENQMNSTSTNEPAEIVTSDPMARSPVASDPLDDLSDAVTEIALVDEAILGTPTPEVISNQTRAVTELGERHELISARLGQVGEILQQLNDVHTLVERLAPPLSSTFRHHQILAGQNIALQHALDRVNEEISGLREKEVTATARATSLDLELRHLNDSYAQIQALQVQAEKELRLAAGEIRTRDATISDLERRVQELTAEIHEVRDDLANTNSRWQEGEVARSSLVQQLRQERENLQALEREHQSLKTSLQQTVTETSRIGRQMVEAEEMAAAAKAHSLQVEQELAQSQAEKAQLIEKLGALELSMDEERRSLNVKTASMRDRAETLDKLLNQARQELATQSEALREAVHKGEELQSAITRLESRSEKSVTDLQQKEDENRHLTEANISLNERVDTLSRIIQSKDEALQRNREVLESQADRLGALEGKSFSQVETYERQLAGFAAALEQERAEKALLEGTLEAARQEKQRLQRQLVEYRTNLLDKSSADIVQLSKVPYPTVETLGDLMPKPSLEAPSIIVQPRDRSVEQPIKTESTQQDAGSLEGQEIDNGQETDKEKDTKQPSSE